MFNRALRMLLVATFAAAVALVALNGTATADEPSSGAAPQGDPGAKSAPWVTGYWQYQDDGDKGGRSIRERVYHPGEGGYAVSEAEFRAHGDDLYMFDEYDNNRDTIAKIWVGGSGPATYYSKDFHYHTHYDLSYAEGQTVYLQVCTSDSPNAACTAKVKHDGVS